MKKRPKGSKFKYRNLVRRGDCIYFERVLPGGRRVRRSLKTDDWADAAAQRDVIEREIGAERLPHVASPTFAEAAESVRGELAHLAATTRDDREKILGEDGPLVKRFGAFKLDAIRRRDLLDWWSDFVEKGEGREKGARSPRTGKNHLDALSSVFVWAMERDVVDENPCEGLRAVLRRKNRTQRGRAENDRERANPIEKPEDVAAIADAARAEGGAAFICTLLLLDAGLRLGEATALDWQDVEWDRRALHVRQSLSRGKHLGPTKSGRSRSVSLSRRLLKALRESWLAAGRPESGFVAQVDHANYRHRALRRMLKAAGIAQPLTPHGLRDTYASHLLSAGIQLAYISTALGHANAAITATHYARWCGGDQYRPPIPLAEGEVPADLLARLGKPAQPTPATAEA